MANVDHRGFDSSANIAYIHQDKGGRNPPGGGELEARVSALESTMTDIKVSLARIEGRFDTVATKDDLHRVDTKLSKVDGALEGKLSYWQFVGTGLTLVGLGIAVATFALRWATGA